MNQKEFENQIKELGIIYDEDQKLKLERYYELLIEHNKVMNLTGIIDHDEVYLKHFYDSLTLIKSIDLDKEQTLCDLGSGAGFPGIVLKIFYPNLSIVLIDSLNKRINFLNTVIKELNLKNIEAIHTRIEDYSKENKEKFDIVTARAVAPLNILIELGINLVKVNKYFIAMKGNINKEPKYENMLNKLNCRIEKIYEFNLPIEESRRSIVKIKKVKETLNCYPRKYSEIKKNPL